MKRLRWAAWGFLLAAPCAAQVDMGVGVGPGGFDSFYQKKHRRQEAVPVAVAMSMALGPEIWTQVGVSTMGPVEEISRLVGEGYYKLELIQLVLLSAQARRPLKDALEKRGKEKRLSEIAAEYKLDYDKVYDAALAVQHIIDRDYLPRLYEKKGRKKTIE